jgi:hypothetical protein
LAIARTAQADQLWAMSVTASAKACEAFSRRSSLPETFFA